jgi:hypothetical protein
MVTLLQTQSSKLVKTRQNSSKTRQNLVKTPRNMFVLNRLTNRPALPRRCVGALHHSRPSGFSQTIHDAKQLFIPMYPLIGAKTRKMFLSPLVGSGGA